MNKENLAFLFGGFAFGILVGYGAFSAVESAPDLTGNPAAQGAAPAPAGPMAPTQVGSAAQPGAPMMAEVNALKRHLQQEPEDHAALVRLANIYHDVSMWDQAVTYYERALQIVPDNPDVLTDTGVCYKGMGEYEKALDFFRRAHQRDPSHWQSLFNTVVVAGFDLGRFDVAAEAMAELEAFEPLPPHVDQLKQALEHARARAGG